MKTNLLFFVFLAVVALFATLLNKFGGTKMRFFYGWAMEQGKDGMYRKAWVFRNVFHGPQVWAWWQLFSVRRAPLDVHAPSTGHRFWVYTRWGSLHFDVVFDRRKAYA